MLRRMDRQPSDFQKRALWAAATGIALFVIGALIVAVVLMVGRVLGFLQAVLVPLAVAGIIAYLLDPLVRWFQRRGMSRLRAVLMVFASSLVAFALLLAVMIPMIGNQVQEFHRSYEQHAATVAAAESKSFSESLVDSMIHLRNTYPWLRPGIDHLLSPPDDAPAPSFPAGSEIADGTAAQDAGKRAAPALKDTRLWSYSMDKADDVALIGFGWVKGSANKVLGSIGLLIGFAMVPIYLYFFLKETSSIKEHWHEYVPLRASQLKDEVIDVINEINGYLLSFFRGQMVVAFIDGLLVGIALSIFRLPLGLVIGVMLAILGVIPYIGNIICLVPACVLAYVHFGNPDYQYGWLGSNPWTYVAATAFIFFAVQQINSLVTTPKIVGDSVGLHPMTVIFSMLFWSLLLGGFIGALLAVPLTASVKVLFRRYIWERKIADATENETYTPSKTTQTA
jgi:predicted PurR-regulated permease PerM